MERGGVPAAAIRQLLCRPAHAFCSLPPSPQVDATQGLGWSTLEVKLSFGSFQAAQYLGMSINNPQPNTFWPTPFLNLGIYYDINAPAYGALFAQDAFYVNDGSSIFVKQQAATSLSIMSDPVHFVNLPLYSLGSCNSR